MKMHIEDFRFRINSKRIDKKIANNLLYPTVVEIEVKVTSSTIDRDSINIRLIIEDQLSNL